VQSRIKELEKIERIEIPLEEPTPHFTFPQPPPSGRTVVEVSGLSMQYGEKKVLEDVSFTIERGDRIALVGVNGAGKSTLIRLLSGQESPVSGTLKLGHNVLAEYFAQDQYKVLDPAARMLDDIGRAAPKVPEKDLRSLLGCFLFSGDDVFKQLGVLSGGERNRYALARILVSPANFLLLDEPTNHLDLRAKDVLLEAIGKFSGTVIFVSHDRYFIDGLAQKVFEVAKAESPTRGSEIHVFPGNYEDYLWRKEGGAAALAQETAAAAVISAKSPAAPILPGLGPDKDGNGAAMPATPVKKINPIRLRQMQERLAQVEAEMPRVESSLARTEQALGVYVSAEETQRLSEELVALRHQQASLTSEWEELSVQLEEQGAPSG
jgi:ATP-binding cassette, subfamily F, member 3